MADPTNLPIGLIALSVPILKKAIPIEAIILVTEKTMTSFVVKSIRGVKFNITTNKYIGTIDIKPSFNFEKNTLNISPS